MATSKKETDEMYETVMIDPWSWADQARLLKASADLSLDEIARVRKAGLSPHDRSQRLLSCMQSYMMLSGFAIENMIKGLLVCRLPKPRSLKDPAFKKMLHHDLIKLVPADVTLNQKETELLTRLQTFTVWAGRYPMPKEAEKYYSSVVNSEVSLKGSDSSLISELFFKFDQMILSENDD